MRTVGTGTSLWVVATLLAMTTPARAQQASGPQAQDGQQLAHASHDTAQASEDVIVTAQRRNETQVLHEGSLGALGDKDAMNTPFAVKGYSSTLILNQQSLSLGQVLENDPAIRTSYGYGNASEQFVIRGFPLYGEDIAIDGLYGLTPRQLVSPELFDQVQVLNGASAFLFGAAPGGTALGGTITLKLKRATDRPINRFTANYLSDAHIGGAFDVGRRFGEDGAFGIRVNGAGRWGDIAIDDEYRSSTVLGTSFDWRGDHTRISLDLAYQGVKVRHMRPMVHLAGGVTEIPRPPRADINYGQAWNYTTLRDIFGILSIEQDLGSNFVIYATGGAKDSAERGNYQGFTVTDASTGAAYATGSNIPRNDNDEAGQAGLRGKFNLGPITNEINIGASHNRSVNRNAYAFGSFAGSPNNLYNPAQVPEPAYDALVGGDQDDPFPINRTRLTSFFASDTLSIADDLLQVTAGLRRQNIYIRTYSYATDAKTTDYNESDTTPVVGIVFRPTKTLSFYGNRIEGLVQGPVAPGGTINGGEVFPPFRSVQYEIGGKVAFGRWNGSVALYKTDQPQSFTLTNPSGQQVFTVDGSQRNRGLEVSFDGEPVRGLRVIAGFAVTDARQRKTTGGIYDGNHAIGVPNYTANANVEWDLGFLPGVTLTGRLIQTGEEYFNQSNTLRLDAWTRADLGARYVIAVGGAPVTFRFNVDNIANNSYWASSLGGYLVQGQPRTFKLSATLDL